MPATPTSRLSLAAPIGIDPPSEYRIAITTNANALDAALLYGQGGIGARPAANTLPNGYIWRATDTKQTWISDGTTWALIGGRQYHAFTTDDFTSQNPYATVVGSFFVDPSAGENITLVEVIIHCVTVGSTPSTFSLQTDHAAHGSLVTVSGLGTLSPTTTQTIVTPSGGALALASLDRIALVATNAASGNSLGISITVVTEHSP
jgi:hypothetical protein